MPTTSFGAALGWPAGEEVNTRGVCGVDPATGRPKGVAVPHAGIVNRLLWMQDTHELTTEDRVLVKTPSSFDVSVWEFLWPLITAATLVVARPEGHKVLAYLAALIRREHVTTVHFVPSMLAAFLEERSAAHCTGLRRVLCSAKAFPAAVAERFHTLLDVRLHNLCGPTEADVTFASVGPGSDVVPIGRPVGNLRLHVAGRGPAAGCGRGGRRTVPGGRATRPRIRQPSRTDR
ncbi:AMP-binding protein [Streptomyces sp. AK08-01B]|nr:MULTISPECIES: AMP-binding protein [unclassified Streptomyces]MDX3772387.1 AMP-binding protein [Streptomyces sp. AK08-01B]MDX3821885.1 AMP-binding protein [Streptomyces sp. AK08-01A]